jgi:hypothetical protein
MSKDGPHNARRALSIMVDTVSMFDLHLHEYYSREKARTRSGKMAHVLTMRKLVRMMYAMLTKKEKWKWEKKALTERKLESTYKLCVRVSYVREGGAGGGHPGPHAFATSDFRNLSSNICLNS